MNNNFLEDENKNIDTFGMSSSENKQDGIFHSSVTKEKIIDKNSPSNELTHEIISKFDKLLNREEYYNFQERAYKLNKAIISIAHSQNLHVSSFNSNNSNSNTPENVKRVNSNLDISPNKLLKMLDELVKEKESNSGQVGKNGDHNINKSDSPITTNINGNCSFTASSSEEDTPIDRIQQPLSHMELNRDNAQKKKRLFKYLYNYELLYKTILLEKSLNRIENESKENSEPSKKNELETLFNERKICEEIGMNAELLSNFSKSRKKDSTISDSSTPISNIKSIKGKSSLGENGSSTPSINKFFFEDKEFQSRINNKRRRSLMEEQKIIIDKNIELNPNAHRRKSDFLHGCKNPIYIQSKFFSFNPINEDESYYTNFDFTKGEDDKTPSNLFTNSNPDYSSTPNYVNYHKRSSVFKERNDREFFPLSNIYENEEST